MRRVRLSTLLVGMNVGLLLLAVAGVVVVAVRLLQQLADEQSLARVAQAGLIARQQINDTSDSVVTSAELLSERPTLRRLIEQNDQVAMIAFLAQFQETSQLDGIAVLRDGVVLVQSGIVPPATELSADNLRFVIPDELNQPLLLGARAQIDGLADTAVVVVKRLDQAFTQQLSAEIGLPVAIFGRQTTLSKPPTAIANLYTRAMTERIVVAERVPDRTSYIAAAPLFDSDDVVVGVIETELPMSGVAQSVAQFITTLLLLGLGVATLAGVISVLIGRQLGKPLRTLTRSAARIGAGDLATPIPAAPSAEIGTLATTLEEMRWQLLQLTNDLRRQQAEAQAIVTGIVEGVFSVDRERRIQYLNPQAAALLGTSVEAALGRFCGDVLQPQGSSSVRPCVAQCPIIHARFRGAARATEHLQLPNGEQRTVVITSAPDIDGLQVQVMRDETEIEATRRLRDAILANISHEFRTPLSAQLASIELLLDQLPELSIEQIGQLVRSQQRGTLRLTQLIDNLLESARIEAGQYTIRRQHVALDEAVEEAIELIRPLFEQREQTVVVDLPYPLPLICGDAPRLTQVFVNLLGNANKFAPSRSTIYIGGMVASKSVTLWVDDEGPGLPVMTADNLFTRFVRSVQGEPEQSGAGLGLWLVKSIVERHGGTIEAQTTSRGARLRLVLPLEPDDENIDR